MIRKNNKLFSWCYTIPIALTLVINFCYAQQPPFQPTVKILPLESISLIILNKITGQKKVVDIPWGADLRIGNLKIHPKSCQAGRERYKTTPDYKADILVWEENAHQQSVIYFEGTLSTPVHASPLIEHPVFSIFLEKCTFREK